MSRLPAIVTDIDGVVMVGTTPIPGVPEALEKVRAGMDKSGGPKG